MTRAARLACCLLLLLYLPVWAQTPLPPGASFQAGFSPKGGAEEILLTGIREAEHSIRVAAYSFTSKKIALALLDAHKRGVNVQVVADEKSGSGRYSAVTFLANQGVPVRLNGNYAIFHHKFVVFDDRHIETGSFNFPPRPPAKMPKTCCCFGMCPSWLPSIPANGNGSGMRAWN